MHDYILTNRQPELERMRVDLPFEDDDDLYADTVSSLVLKEVEMSIFSAVRPQLEKYVCFWSFVLKDVVVNVCVSFHEQSDS